MTDLNKYIELLKSFGYTEAETGKSKVLIEPKEYLVGKTKQAETLVTLGSGTDGYTGFHCTFLFDKDGKFVGHDCYE